MEEWQPLLDSFAAALISPHGKAITTFIILALPFLAIFAMRAFGLAAVFVAAGAYPAWMLSGAYVTETLALWLGLVWLTTILLSVLTMQSETERRGVASLMSRVVDMDVRVEAFLDALDRRTALVQELTRTEPTPPVVAHPAPAPRAAPSAIERELAD